MRKLSAEIRKEAKELSILCGVDVMVLVYNGTNVVEPLAVWPPDPTKALERYLATLEAEIERQADELASQPSSSSTAAGEGIDHADAEPDSGKHQ
ncbi:hypothetical protein LINGRAHAP2_LOCUS16272, partial [Linum grandiflorum]